MEVLNNFKSISLSHKNAPLALREKVSLNESEAKNLMQNLKEYFNLNDTLVVSTCNRTEVYYSHDSDKSLDIIKLIAIQKNLNLTEDELKMFEIINEHDEAVLHLFRVSMGLESQVVGDIQISNQIKHAYQWSADMEMAGPFLHRLMHSIFYTNKQVVQETQFRDGAASVSYATVELAQDLTANVTDPKVLIVGLGEIGADVCRNLKDSAIKHVKIANRTHQKAVELAHECGFEAVDFYNLKPHCAEADVIISSINTEKPFFDVEKLKELQILSHKFFIDLAVPRSVDAEIETIPGVLVYNIDHLQSKASVALEKRMASIPAVEKIVNDAIENFNEWTKEMTVSPVINKLKNALEDIRQQEMAKYVKKVDDEKLKLIDDITKNLMQKIIKLPVIQLKAACKRGEAETLIDVLNDLFDLEKQESKRDGF